MPEHRVGQFSNAFPRGSSSSYQPRSCNVWPAAAGVDGRVCVQLWRLKQQGTHTVLVLGQQVLSHCAMPIPCTFTDFLNDVLQPWLTVGSPVS